MHITIFLYILLMNIHYIYRCYIYIYSINAYIHIYEYLVIKGITKICCQCLPLKTKLQHEAGARIHLQFSIFLYSLLFLILIIYLFYVRYVYH